MKAIAQTGTIFEDGTYEKEEVADDPFVARFLSPDPIIQSPGNAQNYNRYSYALNNPLKYTDPSGYKYRGADMGFNPGGFFNHGFKLPQNGTMGSGSHWSDGMMGEYHDFVFFSSKKFNSRYGPQASEIGYYLWSDESRAEKWRNGETSIEQVRKEFEYAGGFWMDFSRVSPVKIKQSKYKGLKIITIKGGIDIVSQWVAIDQEIDCDNNNEILTTINEMASITSLLSGTVNNLLTQTKLGSNIAYYLSNSKVFVNATNYVKPVGYWATTVSVISDVMKSIDGTQTWTETGLNTTIAGAAMYVGGWPGIAISLVYSGIKLQVEQYQNVSPEADKQWRRYNPGPY